VTESGVALAARFSLPTNRLRYCGPDDAQAPFVRAITEERDLDAARDALLKFEALEPYLAAIAAKHGRDPLDHDVVEAYWIGNRLLDDFTREDFREVLDALHKRGLPRSVATRLAARLPEHPLPHHAFHVTFVGVGAVTRHVETTLPNMDFCRPSWGRVVRVGGGTASADRAAMRLDGARFGLGPAERIEFDVDTRFLSGLAVGDHVALHWSWPALILSADQLERLKDYTIRAFASASEAVTTGGSPGARATRAG